MTWPIVGWAFLIAVIAIGLFEIRCLVISLHNDLREIRRRLESLERRK